MNNSAISPRCDGECATMLAMPPRYGFAHEDLTTMWLRFRCASWPRRCRYVNFEQVKTVAVRWRSWRFRYASTTTYRRFYCASTALLLRFYCASTTLLPFLLRFASFWPKFRIVAEAPSSGIGVLAPYFSGRWFRYTHCDQVFFS